MKTKLYVLTTLLVTFTILIIFSFNTYLSWNRMLEDKYKETASIAQLLDEFLEDSFKDQLKEPSDELTVTTLNAQLQPFIEKIITTHPNMGAGYYVKDLNSIVAFGPNFNKSGLIDISDNSKARTVYKTKSPYEFYDYSQTRNGIVVANMRPIIRDGEVLGHVWGNVLAEDIFSVFKKDLKNMFGLLVFMLFFAFTGTNIIIKQYLKYLRDFRLNIKNVNLIEGVEPKIPKELLEVYNEVITSRSALVENEKRFRDVVTAFDEFVWETDLEGNYTYLSERVTSIIGYEPHEWIGKKTFEQMLEPYNQTLKGTFEDHAHKNLPFRNLEYCKKAKDGRVVYLSSNGVPMYDKDGKVIGFRGASKDISVEKHREIEINYLAYYDQLTTLPNRTSLTKTFDELIKEDEPFAVLFFDVDQFKKVNDSLGHSAGDELLKVTASRLLEATFEGETVFRFGGDEFILILKNFNYMCDLKARSEQIMDHLSRPFLLQETQSFITTSIGISVYPNHGTDMETLIKNADMAMYKSKENGRKQATLYDSTFENDVTESFQLSNDLIEAIDQEQFVLYYQPQVDLQTGEIIGAEALIRWFHPTKGFIPPDKFIHIAEEYGLILPLGDWILRKACEDRKKWLDEGIEHIRIAVNISIKQFEQPNFVERVQQILQLTNLDSRYLELEITEGVAMTNPDDVIEKLQQLKDLNIFISIDDFGMGYSSLNYLKKLPIHQLKVDRNFVKDITEKNDFAIVHSIISMAHSLELSVVAEGVENELQASILRDLNCTIAQGYLYYKPMPYADFIEQATQKLKLVD